MKQKMHNVGLYYYTKDNNFGDVLNEYIPERLFNCKITKKDIYTAEATFIGSILSPFLTDKEKDLTLPPLNIWGSGFVKETNINKNFIRKIKVYAVRGLLTKKRLEISENTIYDVPLGDPGLLCSKVFTDLDMIKEYEYGIIPHYIDKGNPLLNKLQLKNSTILDIQEPPEIFIKKLVKCKKIISGAMHGLIAADSFHIPNIRMIMSDKICGGDFKYNDYYSAFGIVNHNKIDLRMLKEPITQLDFDYMITNEQIEKIQKDLIRSFPYA